MNGNLLEAIQSLVKVKKVDADIVFDALEMVLLTAYKKETGSNAKTSIKLNRETGDYQIFEEKTVVESIDPESENAINEITVEDAKKIDRSYEAGDLLSIDVTPKNFGRIAAQTAKQVMIQKLREAERGSSMKNSPAAQAMSSPAPSSGANPGRFSWIWAAAKASFHMQNRSKAKNSKPMTRSSATFLKSRKPPRTGNHPFQNPSGTSEETFRT